MKNKSSPEHRNDNKDAGQSIFKNSPFLWALIGLFTLGLSISIYVVNLAVKDLSWTVEHGPFGDFIGGLLNPILTFLSFSCILISIFIQSKELSEQRREIAKSSEALTSQNKAIERQNFEAAFFQMINTLNSIVNSMDTKDIAGNTVTGRDCFFALFSWLHTEYKLCKKKNENEPELYNIRMSYESVYKKNRGDLAHYFRFLYNIYRFIEKSEYYEPYHGKLLRAQLSDDELLIIFYNCLSPRGEKFAEIADHFELFDNLPVEELIDEEHIHEVSRRSFGGNSYFEE